MLSKAPDSLGAFVVTQGDDPGGRGLWVIRCPMDIYLTPFLISTGEIMEGEFPAKAKAMVKEFILKYQKELEEMWEKEQYRKLPPLN